MLTDDLSALTIAELKAIAKERSIYLGSANEKEAIIAIIRSASIEDSTKHASEDELLLGDLNEDETDDADSFESEAMDLQKTEKASHAGKPLTWSNAAYNYSTKPAYQAPVSYMVKPSWKGRQQPMSPYTQPQVVEYKPTPLQRPTNYTPRFGPGAAPPVKQEPPIQEESRPPAVPRADYHLTQTPKKPDKKADDTLPEAASWEAKYTQTASDSPAESTESTESNLSQIDTLKLSECGEGAGLLEIHPDGYGFLRHDNYMPGHQDIYVSAAQIRRFNLRTGDFIAGKTRLKREGDKYSALLYITHINDSPPDETQIRPFFDQLTAEYPTRRIELINRGEKASIVLRILDLLVPMGYGQRGLIIAPSGTGKRKILVELANAIERNNPNAHVILLFVDIRPEDVTEVKDQATCEVVASTFDHLPETHTRMSEMVFERAQRLCEQKKDVVIMVDSLTTLARAYNNIAVQQGRAAAGILNSMTLYKSKKLFGAARNLREGGSLTVVGALINESSQKIDDAIAEEFRGTATMELYLLSELAQSGIFPAFDIMRSNTRRDELLVSADHAEGLKSIRTLLSDSSNKDAVIQLMEMMKKTVNNKDLLDRLKDWIILFNRGGFAGSK